MTWKKISLQDMVIKTVDMWYRCPGNIWRVGELAMNMAIIPQWMVQYPSNLALQLKKKLAANTPVLRKDEENKWPVFTFKLASFGA